MNLKPYQVLDRSEKMKSNKLVNKQVIIGVKIFNCFAKLCFEINTQSENTWQALRDNQLLTETSEQLLLFSPPELGLNNKQKVVSLICGKTYFNQLSIDHRVEWIDDSFALNYDHNLIVCPYFDYRQLSNKKNYPVGSF